MEQARKKVLDSVLYHKQINKFFKEVENYAERTC